MDEITTRLGHSLAGTGSLLALCAGCPGPTADPARQKAVTYHDPCDLGRASGLYETPRKVICAIPGITLREMEHHHEYSLCCGGGGDVEMADVDLTSAVAARRIEEARAAEATILLSACQQCERTLTAALRKTRARVRVMDIAQLVERAMET